MTCRNLIGPHKCKNICWGSLASFLTSIPRKDIGWSQWWSDLSPMWSLSNYLILCRHWQPVRGAATGASNSAALCRDFRQQSIEGICCRKQLTPKLRSVGTYTDSASNASSRNRTERRHRLPHCTHNSFAVLTTWSLCCRCQRSCHFLKGCGLSAKTCLSCQATWRSTMPPAC